MAMKHYNIGICTESEIIFNGFCSIIRRIDDHNVVYHQINVPDLRRTIAFLESLDLFVCDPLSVGPDLLAMIKKNHPELPVMAICVTALPLTLNNYFDAQVSLFDNVSSVQTAIKSALKVAAAPEQKKELTQREREIVIGVVKGLSNKEIASWLNVSVNTVMTHRRNIAAKLEIHSSAGLTIYAIVSKLVSIDEVARVSM